jgi:hypothetical protein
MSVLRWITTISCAALLVSCVTPESSARFAGLSPEDTAAITMALRKHTSAPIHAFYRQDDGTIDVSTEGDGIYSARKIRGKWIVEKEIIVT